MRRTSVFLFALLLMSSVRVARAATTPSLGAADTFSVLTHTYANNTIANGTSLFGDAGYATFSGFAAYVSGATHVNDATYAQAGADQHAALSALDGQPCTVTFAGAVDLATDTSHGTLGIYAPGVYCSAGAMSIGGSITFDGAGTYIFRSVGMLSTSASSHVTTMNGASACDVFWTPQLPTPPVATALGTDTTFVGTVIEPVGAAYSAITVGGGTQWVGRALAFDWSVTTNPVILKYVSITAPTCTPPPSTTASLHVIKTFYNDYGGTAVPSDATVHVKNGAGDVGGSPAAGTASPGTSYTLNADTYAVSEDAFAGYASTFGGDCDATGQVTLAAGDDKTCTISNHQNPPPSVPATLHIIKHVVNDNGGTATASSFMLHVKGAGSFGLLDVSGSPAAGAETPGTSYALAAGTYVVSEDPSAGYTQRFSGDCDDGGNITLTSGADKTCTITNDDIPPASVPPATLRVIKIVTNDNGGTAVVSQAVIHVTNSLGDVAGSPQAGASFPGTAYTLAAGSYNVSENFFPGYTVKVGGDCNDNGDVALGSGDDKTCTITNNDIAHVVVPPVVVPPVVPPITVPVGCDLCAHLAYDVYIVNPDLSERHTGTAWVRVTDRGNGVKRYAFEDATLDPANPLYDYNDAVVDVDYTDCKRVKFMFVSSDASWKHRIKFKVSMAGVTQSDTLVADDSKAVVGTTKEVNATAGVNAQLACAANPSPPTASPAPTSLLGKILLQVQRHGEAWYVLPKTGSRYYMKDGPTAYGMMRTFGLGITDKDLAAIPSVASVDALKASAGVCLSNKAANAVKGKILLQVQQHGEAWYVDVTKCRRLYMKDGPAAYTLMRFLGLGITDADLAKIGIGQ